MADLARLSFNQITCNSWSLPQAVQGCVRHQIPWIGFWRDKVQAATLAESARIVRESGVRVSSLCRGGWFPAETAAARQERIDDNFRAIDEAAALGTGTLVLVCGPIAGRDLDGSRQMVRDGIGAIEAHARARGVQLGIEPLHPMFAADRSVIVTLKQATDLAHQFSSTVGVVIDVFHVWHDPDVYAEIARAAGRIWGFHVSDWPVPLPDILLARTMMGNGVIELRRLREAVDAAGYAGPIEVEIFNRALWEADGNEVLPVMKQRFADLV